MHSLSFPLPQAFLALPLEGEATLRFQELQNRLCAFEDLFHFQRPETPHLSLYFWPTLMEIEYYQIVRQSEKIAARTTPFTIDVTEAGTFVDPKTKLERVLLLTIARSRELATAKKLCPWPNTRPFIPHITLARMKNPNAFRVHRKQIMKLLEEIAFSIPCDRLRLYAEVEGIKQTPVKDFLLQEPSFSLLP